MKRQDEKDRRDERRGEDRYLRDRSRRDYREIKEDRYEVANLPQGHIQYSVGEEMRDMPYEYDDTMSGIDRQARENHRTVVRSIKD